MNKIAIFFIVALIGVGIGIAGMGYIQNCLSLNSSESSESNSTENLVMIPGVNCAKGVNITNISAQYAYISDPKSRKKSITYTIDEPARVRIRFQAKWTRELYLATPVDWEFRDAGTHTEYWDGLDHSGRQIDRKEAYFMIHTEAMSTYKPGLMPLEYTSDVQIIHGHKFGHIHNQHHTWACKTMLLNITSIRDNETLSGKVVIKAEVNKIQRGYGDYMGYGVRYYIGHELVGEQFYGPDSDGKFSYELDTTAFPDGEHMLYVGMCDHNDHGTSASVRVRINNSAP